MPELPPFAVTTSGYGEPAFEAKARAAAQALGIPFLHRRKKAPLGQMLGARASALLVFSGEGVLLVDREGSLKFSPGMAKLRIKRFDAGERDDTLLRLSELGPGDRVLDATLGLGADALTCARAVGPSGLVVGVEKSLPLAALVRFGLADDPPDPLSAEIQVVHGDAARYLAQTPDRSFDCVLFDPMFEKPRSASPSFEVLRRFADHSPLTEELIAHGRRIARRWVMIKASRYSQELSRYGLIPERASRSATVVWARVPPLK